MRLSRATLDRLHPAVRRPPSGRAPAPGGIVHLGLGAFHRAHQAVYTEDAGDGWDITGVSLRSESVRAALEPQDGLFTVTERAGGAEQTRLIASVRQVLVVPHAPDAVSRALAAPDTHVVTITVTEKGYHLGPDGRLDLAALPGGGTIYHLLAAALAERRRSGSGGLTILSCDNLADNGSVLGAALTHYLESQDSALAAWFEAQCTCPATMVDRIVPAVIPADLDHVEARIGLRDEAAVVTEAFRQWVIEDRFAGPRPRWEAAGAQLVATVKPYETAKLRMLNGTHSALAYLGLAAGAAHVHEAIAIPSVRATAERLMREEAALSFDPAEGQDLAAYADALVARFSNPGLPHRLAQIAMDGSQKIGPRWLATLADDRRRGRDCPAILEALAAWMAHVRGGSHVNDPWATKLADLWRQAGADGIMDALFGERGLYADRWIASPGERAILKRWLSRA